MTSLKVTIDGTEVMVPAGTSVAAALLRNDRVVFRRSVRGEPRAPLCGMGICYECRVTIDGVPHARSCLVPCRDGIEIRTDG